jgi:hypothetical protein
MDIKNLTTHLLQIDRKSISDGDFTEMIHLSRSIVQAYLRGLRYTVVKLCSEHGISETDLAFDCIAEVFSRNQSGEFPLVRSFLASLNHNIESLPAEEVFIVYKSFLIRIADTQLARLYAQADPMGAKIHRNLRDCLKGPEVFSLRKDFRGMVMYPTQADPLDQLPAYPLDTLLHEFCGSAQRSHSTHELIEILHGILVSQDRFRRSLPLIDVVQMFKKIYELELEYESGNEPSLLGTFSPDDIERIRAEVEDALKEKIVVTYLAKGKIDRRQAEGLWLACREMISDWCKPESEERSLHGYLNRYCPMDAQTYENTFRVKMEYLLKVARKEFAIRVNGEL